MTKRWSADAVRVDEDGALRAWGEAEADAVLAEGIARRERERARVAWRCAAERRRRADDAGAARQAAFAHGLRDAAEAHACAARAAEARAQDAERRARALRDEADARRSVAWEAQLRDVGLKEVA
ncbi:MAG: hypothetical protein ACJ79L_14400 [Anaeromyxobacteraceae bacterium]